MARIAGALVGAVLLLGVFSSASATSRPVLTVSNVTFNLEVDRSGTGTGTVTSLPGGIACGGDCEADFADGTMVELTATAGANSDFDGWLGCDSVTADKCRVTLSADRSVTARFAANAFTLTVRRHGSGDGDVTSSPAGISCPSDCTELYSPGTTVRLTADPDPNSTFSDWSVCAGTGTCEVTMDRDRTVTATFTLDTFDLRVSKAGAGEGTVTSDPAGIDCDADCSATFDSGQDVTLTADADSNSTFEDWIGCDDQFGSECTVTMDGDRTVRAIFDGRSFDSAVTISFARGRGRFSGQVFSDRAACERNRGVLVRKRAPGRDPVRARVLTGARGRWVARGFRRAQGGFYAKVLNKKVEESNGAIITCLSDGSRMLGL